MFFSLLPKVNLLLKQNRIIRLSDCCKYYTYYNTSKPDHDNLKNISFIQKKNDEIRALRFPKKINYEKLSSNIWLQTVELPDDLKKKFVKAKNSVILFSHHDSSDESIEKITSFYHQNFLDVLVVRPQKMHFFLPEMGNNMVKTLLTKLSGNNLPLNLENFIIHTVSSGVFLYAFFCNQVSTSFNLFSFERIKAQVFDGLILGNYKDALKAYRYSFPETFTIGSEKFIKATENFLHNTPKVDTLVYHSTDDVLCIGLDDVLSKWKASEKMNVDVCSWSRSQHAQNCIRHPDKYLKALETFLLKTHILHA